MKHREDDIDDSKDQMTVVNAADHFNESVPETKSLPDFTKMTRDEVDKWERDQSNSNDIYRIAARVKNLARADGASLTPVGEILANSHVHVLNALYKFAETLGSPKKEELILLLRKHEEMPGKVIAASKALGRGR